MSVALLRVLLVASLLVALAQAGQSGKKKALKGSERTPEELEREAHKARLKCAMALHFGGDDDDDFKEPEDPDLLGVVSLDIMNLPYCVSEAGCGLVFSYGDSDKYWKKDPNPEYDDKNINWAHRKYTKITCEPREYFEETRDTIAVFWPDDEPDPTTLDLEEFEERESHPPSVRYSERSFDYFVTLFMDGYHRVDKQICDLWKDDVESVLEKYDASGPLERPTKLIDTMIRTGKRDKNKFYPEAVLDDAKIAMKRCKSALIEVASLLDEYEIPADVLGCLSSSDLLESISDERRTTGRSSHGIWKKVADSFDRARLRLQWLKGPSERETYEKRTKRGTTRFLSPHSENDDAFDRYDVFGLLKKQ